MKEIYSIVWKGTKETQECNNGDNFFLPLSMAETNSAFVIWVPGEICLIRLPSFSSIWVQRPLKAEAKSPASRPPINKIGFSFLAWN